MILKMVPNVNAHPIANATTNHVPGMLAYTDYQNGKLVKVPIDKIVSAVDDNIKQYGYSVIVFHPNYFLAANATRKHIGLL